MLELHRGMESPCCARRYGRAKAGLTPREWRVGGTRRKAKWGWLKGPTQNPTLKLRTYQSYDHTHTHTHTHRDSKCESAFILISLSTYLTRFQSQYSLFFLLHAWFSQTPITFWTMGRTYNPVTCNPVTCNPIAIAVTNMFDSWLYDGWVRKYNRNEKFT